MIKTVEVSLLEYIVGGVGNCECVVGNNALYGRTYPNRVIMNDRSQRIGVTCSIFNMGTEDECRHRCCVTEAKHINRLIGYTWNREYYDC